MLDKIFAFKGQLFDREFNPAYTPDQAITDMVLSQAKSPTAVLTVIFSPWHISKRLIKQLEQKYLAQHSSVLVCNFSPHILSNDSDQVADSFQYIADTVSRKVNLLQTEYSYASVNLVGYSLGNVMLGMTAPKIRQFDDVTMVVPGSDLLNCLWHSIRTRQLRRALEINGNTYASLQRKWVQLAPIAHVEALRGHRLHIMLSEKDTYIPYRYGLALIDELVAHHIDATVDSMKHSGHVWTSARHIFSRTA